MGSERLIIVGAGGFGFELRSLLSLYRYPIRFDGFIDNRKVGSEILGPIDGHLPLPQAVYLSAFGDPRLRADLILSLIEADAKWVNLISPLSSCASTMAHESGIVILGNTSVANNVSIGRHTLIQGFCAIGHDVRIGKFCTLNAFAFLGGGADVGDGATIHPHATVLPGVRVGEGAVVGAGSVVIRDVDPGCTVFGNPAKVIFRRAG